MVTLLIYRFLETYYRHRWLYLIPIVLMIAAAGVFFTISKPKYIARGSIYVQTESFLSALNSVTASNNSWWATPAQTVIGDMNELIKTDAFIRAVIYQTDLEEKMDDGSSVVSETISEVRDSIWIVALGDNQIQINASHEDAKIAYQIANSVLSSFVQWQVNAQRTEGEAAQAFFADLIKVYEADLEKARSKLLTYLQENPPPLRGNRTEIQQLEIERLQGDVEIARSRYTSALEKEENARLALAQIEGDTRQSYTIIDAPLLPEKPEVSRKELAIQAAIFLLSGVILSIAAVAGNMILDRTFRFPIDVFYGTHLPVLAMIPDTTVRLTRWQRLKQRLGRKKRSKVETSEEENIPADETDEKEDAGQKGKAKPSWFQQIKRRRSPQAEEHEAAENLSESSETEAETQPETLDEDQGAFSGPEGPQTQGKPPSRRAKKKAPSKPSSETIDVESPGINGNNDSGPTEENEPEVKTDRSV